MFKPEEVIFVPVQDCNLSCSHCYVKKTSDKISSKYAIKFLNACAKNGIARVGFSGGEPFLRPEFLFDICEAACENNMFFDRLMTNAVWHKNQSRLKEVLDQLAESGFDGTFGVSFDSYHNQSPKKVAEFIREVFAIWGRRDCVEIISVISDDNSKTFTMLNTLAGFLGAKIVKDEEGLPEKLLFKDVLSETERDTGKENDEIYIGKIELTPTDCNDAKNWCSNEWFEEDYCAGPGHVLYVHGDGKVAACCGYANEEDPLIIGNIKYDSFGKIMRKAHANEFIKLVYEEGLSTEIKRMQAKGHKFPGKTNNNCLFCRYIIEDFKKSL